VNLQSALATEDEKIEAKTLRTARLRAVAEANGKLDHMPITPSQWFTNKFPALTNTYGDAVLEETNKHGVRSVRDVNEDFLAATAGDKGNTDGPTVFVPTEGRFYRYSPAEGIFIHQREPIFVAQWSQLLLDCARACKGLACETQALEFRLRDSASLAGVVRKARGLLEVSPDFFSTKLTEYIPCANGMLRLSDNALLPFSPTYRRRNKLTVPFDASATCPAFLDVLMRPALEPEDLDLAQRACGLALLGENIAQKIIIYIGTAGGGKGCLVRVVNGIIG
jgi:hypothetical protein